jgi:lauroyl/myristoyl acyltransferase
MRRFYANKQKEYVDLFILGRKDYGKYLQGCSEEGIRHIDQVLSKGKGMIGLNFHFSSINLISAYVICKGYKATPILALPAYINGTSRPVSQLVLNVRDSIWRERGNFQIINSSRSLVSLVRTQYRCLSKNQLISAAGDGPLGKKFTLVDFFNVKLKVPLGPALMSAKSAADMVPNFAIRRRDNFQHFIFKEPIKVEGEDEETLKKVAQSYFKYLEYYVSQYPDQWIYWPRMEVEGVENGVPVVWLPYYRFFEAETSQPASTAELEEAKKA